MSQALREAFRVLQSRSISPLDWEWLAVVGFRRVPRSSDIEAHRSDSNLFPLSEFNCLGTLKGATQFCKDTLATVQASMCLIRITSRHHVNQSIRVIKYLYPLDLGSRPTSLTCTQSVLLLGQTSAELQFALWTFGSLSKILLSLLPPC